MTRLPTENQPSDSEIPPSLQEDGASHRFSQYQVGNVRWAYKEDLSAWQLTRPQLGCRPSSQTQEEDRPQVMYEMFLHCSFVFPQSWVLDLALVPRWMSALSCSWGFYNTQDLCFASPLFNDSLALSISTSTQGMCTRAG